MGCDCCKNTNPKDYNSCKIANHKSFKGIYFAPCGTDFNSFENEFSRGSKYTASKKKRKRK